MKTSTTGTSIMRTLYAALALLMLALAPSSASAGNVPSNCDAGSYLVGFEVMAGDYVDRIAGVCAPYNAASGSLGQTTTLAQHATSGGGSPQRVLCPDGSVVTDLHYWNPLVSGRIVIEDIRLTCFSAQRGHAQTDSRTIHTNGDHTNDTDKNRSGGSAVFSPQTNTGCHGKPARGYTAEIYQFVGMLGLNCAEWPSLFAGNRSAMLNAAREQKEKEDREVAMAARIHGRLARDAATPPGPPYAKIEGMWKTTQGTMQLTESTPTIVTGTYHPGGGQISIHVSSGRLWKGFWAEVQSDRSCGTKKQLNSEYWGRVAFIFNADKSHFEGTWSYCGDEPVDAPNTWSGDRVQ